MFSALILDRETETKQVNEKCFPTQGILEVKAFECLEIYFLAYIHLCWTPEGISLQKNHSTPIRFLSVSSVNVLICSIFHLINPLPKFHSK